MGSHPFIRLLLARCSMTLLHTTDLGLQAGSSIPLGRRTQPTSPGTSLGLGVQVRFIRGEGLAYVVRADHAGFKSSTNQYLYGTRTQVDLFSWASTFTSIPDAPLARASISWAARE